MENIQTVADFFLHKEPMTHKKLQKLCYYSQAWYLANYGEPLVADHFEAWIHGPVSPALYNRFRDWGWLTIPQLKHFAIPGNNIIVSLLEKVYEVYGQYTGDELEKISHNELPWIHARGNCNPTDYSRNHISEEEMKKFYGEKIGKKW